ncbi:MAG: tetratricopeptide repeat protein, partial [Candidatus Eremiobacteraeota bacterium]|nr:tetratricopeptide repeat protein [Candidatus Eremiobacteraeota bacterium]
YREDDLGFSHPLRAARRRLEYDGLAHHLALPRLNADSVAELVRTLGDQGDVATVARALHARSDGNPFYLEEMLRDLNEAGRLQLDNGRWSFDGAAPSAVPVAAREAIASRAARLSPQAAALLDVAAIAGDAFDTELLREATGWLEAAVLDALGTLIDRRIVVTQRPGAHAEYAFASSVIRTVVYDAIPEAIRARRHRRVAAVMTQLYEDRRDEVALQLALHWERGREPEAAAEEFVRAARRALGAFANEEADAHLERALHFAAGRRLRFEALMLREGIAAARGDRDAQNSMLQSLGALAHEIDDEDAICAVLDRRLALADVTGARRSQHVLLRLLERRVRRSGEARWKRDALQARARYLRAINDFDGARAAFEEVMVLTEQTGDRETLAAARLAYADTYIYEGRLDEARAALTDLRVALDAASNRGALVRTLMSFARAALVQQDYGAMSHFAEEAHRISRAIGDREGEALALHTLANGLVYTFRVDEAREQYQRALEIYERIWHRVGIASICVDLGLFHTELGLLDRALELFARARTVAEEIGFRWVSCVEAIDRSYCLRLQHALPEAKAAAEYALAVAGEIRSQPLLSAALGTLGCAESALGAHHDAIAHLEEGVALRREAGPTPRLGDNLCALTLAYLRSGDPEAAAAPAAELLALYEANPKLAPQPTEWLGAIAHAERRVGREHQANALLRRADSVMRARAAAIGDADARAAFLALPFNREVTEALAVGV